MKPLPFTDFGAHVAFYGVLVPFVALELVIRLRSLVDREGAQEDRASFALLYVAVATGIVGPFVIAGTCAERRLRLPARRFSCSESP